VQPGVSTAAVALSRGINANLLRRWIRESQACLPPSPEAPPVSTRVACSEHTSGPAFVPLAMPAVPSQSGDDIRIELQRNATTITLSWPIAAAGDCASWLRDLLR
jgi:hypothetical protein